MASFVIEGGYSLHGEIVQKEKKNEVLEIICATLLTDDTIIVHNVPDILDVNNLIQLLRDMGIKISKLDSNDYSFQTTKINW